MAVKPRTPVPDFEVSTIDAGRWRLSGREPENFCMVVVYRGLHCPICRGYLADLARRLPDFRSRGVDVLAMSSDTQERAQGARDEWRLGELPIGYGLPIGKARELGLYISHAIKEGEPPEFAEPGLFLVRPDGTLYCAAINTMPFARPHFDDVLNAIDFVLKNNYPARGEA